MASNSLSTFAGALKEVTAKQGINSQMNESHVLLSQMETDHKEGFNFGAYGIISVKTSRGGAATFVAATGATLPTGRAMGVQKAKIYPKYLLGNMIIDDQLIKQAVKDEDSFANALESVKDDSVTTMKKAMNTALYYDQKGFMSGILDVNTVANANNAAFTDVLVDNVNAFYVGQVVDHVNSAGATVDAAIVVQYIHRKTNVVVFSGTITTFASTDQFVNASSYNLSIDGLTGNLNDASGADFFGISRSAYPAINIEFFGGADAGHKVNFTEDLLVEALDWPGEAGNGSNPELSLWDPALVRTYATKLMGSKRFLGNEKLAGGYNILPYSNNGKECAIYADPHAPKGTIYLLNPSTWHFLTLTGLDWVDVNDNGGIIRLNSTYLYHEAFPRFYCNLFCDTPNANVVLRNLQ